MSKYTTGEIAKLCNVSVRTVQYYDGRKILCPSEISEGGRRIYTESDLKKMQVICYLRELGFSIENIKTLLLSQNSEKVISLLLNEQEKVVKEELEGAQETLKRITDLKKALQASGDFSIENIHDATNTLQNKKKLKTLRATILFLGLPVTLLQWAGILYWIFTGKWWLFALWFGVALTYGVWVSLYYFNRVSYLCPSCEHSFKPKFKHALFANHTPKTRKLTCPKCHEKNFCVEIYKEKEKNA